MAGPEFGEKTFDVDAESVGMSQLDREKAFASLFLDEPRREVQIDADRTNAAVVHMQVRGAGQLARPRKLSEHLVEHKVLASPT